jgi:hypothetical protein
MPDIAMCADNKCPLKEECYRYSAKVNTLYQSYSDFKYEDGCEYFIKIDKDGYK